MALRTLILNADYSPLKVVGWKKAFMIIYKDVAYPVVYHKKVVIDTKGREHPVPSIIVLKEYQKFNSGLAKCTLRNVLIRDLHTCQYCGFQFEKKLLSVDHVIPRSLWRFAKMAGSPTNFHNVVAACKPCNKYKADSLLERAKYPRTVKEGWLLPFAGRKIELIREPKGITYAELLKRQIQVVYHPYPVEWDTYIRK